MGKTIRQAISCNASNEFLLIQLQSEHNRVKGRRKVPSPVHQITVAGEDLYFHDELSQISHPAFNENKLIYSPTGLSLYNRQRLFFN
jgi:hypothetical protein